MILILIITFSGCAEPIGEDKSEFVGLWKSNEISLLIKQSGSLEYESKKGSVSTSISMPIKEISNNEIKAGFLFLSSSFKLEGGPKEEGGVKFLIVDGEKLFKADSQGKISQTNRIPPLDEIRDLVNTDINLISKGVIEKDFTNYLKNSSLVYQSQFTNEDLLEIYKKLIDKKIVLNEWLGNDFILIKEPKIKENGVLMVYGKYPNSPTSLVFEFRYVYSSPNWKTLGGTINFEDE